MDASPIITAIKSVTKRWAQQRKAEERDGRRVASRRDALTRVRRTTLIDAAWSIMPQAYMEASGGGKLPAKGRQVFYRARGSILDATGRTELSAQYFEQTLLPQYQREHSEETADWDVVYDARGDFYEPHTGKVVPLGTLEVRHYLQEIYNHHVGSIPRVPFDRRFPTCGPEHRIGALLYVEKQGFDELFRAVHLAERYDLGILSAKGQSVTACRHLADELCGTYGISLLVLRDFDLAGFNILHTLRNDTQRYAFKNRFEVIDLGLRLNDAQHWGLESETVYYGCKKNGEPKDPRPRLALVGATPEETKFLCSGEESSAAGLMGRRIELNAFASDKLVEWIESKLQQHGVKKIVPNTETLETAYRRALQIEIARRQLDAIIQQAGEEAQRAKLPAHLDRIVRKALKTGPALPWDRVLADLAAEEL